ncbi:Vesicle transport protein S20 [Coemansia spiralis]|nr:Vesicle transport protein S20 [Coemansia spiralis]
MSLEDTPEARLRQLAAELAAVEADIEQLREFSGSREEHRRLADSIREQQRGAERLAEQLRASAEECSDAREQGALEEAIGRCDTRAKQVQRSFRLALLQHRANTAATAKRERDLLLSGATTAAELRKRKAQQGHTALSAAADVTAALQETVGMMNREIEKSASNIIAMQTSSEAMQRTKAQYTTMGDMLHMSKRLVRALEQADATDRWLMLGGLLVFSLVTLNVLRKRLWIPRLYTLFGVLRYIFTLGGGRDTTLSSELSRTSSELLTQVVVMATATLHAAAVASATVTPALRPTAAAADISPPSAHVIDALGTTGHSSSADVAADASERESDVQLPLNVRADDAGGVLRDINGSSDEVCEAAEQQPPPAPSKPVPRPGAGPNPPGKRHYTLPVQRPKTSDR